MLEVLTPQPAQAAAIARPRIGFLGVGWIGRNRMEAMLGSGAVEAVAVADRHAPAAEAALQLAPDAERVGGLDEMLEMELDGLVIATPSALHAEQAIAALERGVSVFCQKPLGRSADEVRSVVHAARAADVLLGVDLSYRFTESMRRLRELIRAGELGQVFAADLVFHNAYGPDKDWFYDPRLSGGGCVMDLGVHLVDLALWALDFPAVARVSSSLMAQGEPLNGRELVEDYAVAQLELASGTSVRIACSWRLQAGLDADISAAFYGRAGGAAMRNVGGSFYDFRAERYRGTARETLVEAEPPWGGKAAVAWAAALQQGAAFDPEAERLVQVAETLDRIYGRA